MGTCSCLSGVEICQTAICGSCSPLSRLQTQHSCHSGSAPSWRNREGAEHETMLTHYLSSGIVRKSLRSSSSLALSAASRTPISIFATL